MIWTAVQHTPELGALAPADAPQPVGKEAKDQEALHLAIEIWTISGVPKTASFRVRTLTFRDIISGPSVI